MRVLEMREPFCPQRGFLGTAFIVRIEEGDNFETLPDHERRTLVKVPWADRVMALPFLTLLAPSKRFYADKARAPKTLLDWARQAALQIHRWLPDRYIVLVADSAFAAIEFLAAVRSHVCVVPRLRLDANLFGFPPQKRKGRGRPAIKGKPHKKLSAALKVPKVSCRRSRVGRW